MILKMAANKLLNQNICHFNTFAVRKNNCEYLVASVSISGSGSYCRDGGSSTSSDTTTTTSTTTTI